MIYARAKRQNTQKFLYVVQKDKKNKKENRKRKHKSKRTPKE